MMVLNRYTSVSTVDMVASDKLGTALVPGATSARIDESSWSVLCASHRVEAQGLVDGCRRGGTCPIFHSAGERRRRNKPISASHRHRFRAIR